MKRDMISADTSLEAGRVQVSVLRKLGIKGRAELTFQLNEQLRAIVAAGVRARHPEYDEKTVRLAVIRLRLGEELFREAFGDIEGYGES